MVVIVVLDVLENISICGFEVKFSEFGINIWGICRVFSWFRDMF